MRTSLSFGFYLPLGVLFAVFLVTGAHAQQQVPSSAQPGVVTRTLQQPDRSLTRLEDIIIVPKEERAEGQGSKEKVFVLNQVVLKGSNTYKTEDFSAVYAPYMGKKVSFADLNTIALGMTRKYREDGYVFSRVILPPQRIKDGVLYVEAVEGRITNVTVEGDVKDTNGLIKVFADKIRSAGPANTKEIERYLLLIDDLPGITARSVVKPSKTPGGGDLAIVVEEDPFEGSVGINNRGSKFIGPWRGEVVGAFNSLFGIHDRTTLRSISTSDTEELLFGELTHEEQLGTKVRRVSGESMGKFMIPVPPMEEQERIVSILDKFDALVNGISDGLPAEIIARRQQYEHYRDRLLTFHEAA